MSCSCTYVDLFLLVFTFQCCFLPSYLPPAPLTARRLLPLPSVLLKHFYGITFLAWPFLLHPECSLSLFFSCTKYQYFPSLIFSFLFPFVSLLSISFFCVFTCTSSASSSSFPRVRLPLSSPRQSLGTGGNTSTHDHNFENEKDCDFA